MSQPHFDVFLCHNSEDKPAVIQIADQLKQQGVSPWLDIWELRPGFSWQRVLEEQIGQIGAAAVFVGKAGLGPWQSAEIDAFLREFVNRRCPVIPILLSDAPQKPKLPLFLKGLMWVDFRQPYPDPMEQLIWGITRQKPTQRSASKSGHKAEPASKSASQSDDLSSEKGIDYTKLRDLLKAGKWKEADYETYLVMLQAVGRQENDYIREEELLNFPCTDLHTIDQLWVKYSNGRFGFSVQKKIYLECGGKPDGKYYQEAWKKFGDLVGWRVNSKWITYDEITFHTSGPTGHLPNPRWVGGEMVGRLEGLSLCGVLLLSHRDSWDITEQRTRLHPTKVQLMRKLDKNIFTVDELAYSLELPLESTQRYVKSLWNEGYVRPISGNFLKQLWLSFKGAPACKTLPDPDTYLKLTAKGYFYLHPGNLAKRKVA